MPVSPPFSMSFSIPTILTYSIYKCLHCINLPGRFWLITKCSLARTLRLEPVLGVLAWVGRGRARLWLSVALMSGTGHTTTAVDRRLPHGANVLRWESPVGADPVYLQYAGSYLIKSEYLLLGLHRFGENIVGTRIAGGNVA
jgi:hypothetical protein